MTEDELLRFNPLIAKAFTQFESENGGETTAVMREIAVAGLKTGAAPEKIYAVSAAAHNHSVIAVSSISCCPWSTSGQSWATAFMFN